MDHLNVCNTAHMATMLLLILLLNHAYLAQSHVYHVQVHHHARSVISLTNYSMDSVSQYALNLTLNLTRLVCPVHRTVLLAHLLILNVRLVYHRII